MPELLYQMDLSILARAGFDRATAEAVLGLKDPEAPEED